MSENNTSAVKSVKVISDARNEEILAIFRTLHGKVLTTLQEVGVKPTFNDNFEKCGTEDYKNLHQQSRVLLSAHKQAKWEERIAGIRSGVAAAIAPFMTKREKAYKAFMALDAEDREGQSFNATVAVPVSAMVGAWPTDTSMVVIKKDLEDMGYKVFRGGDDSLNIKVAFVPAKAEVGESAPKSGQVALDAAAE